VPCSRHHCKSLQLLYVYVPGHPVRHTFNPIAAERTHSRHTQSLGHCRQRAALHLPPTGCQQQGYGRQCGMIEHAPGTPPFPSVTCTVPAAVRTSLALTALRQTTTAAHDDNCGIDRFAVSLLRASEFQLRVHKKRRQSERSNVLCSVGRAVAGSSEEQSAAGVQSMHTRTHACAIKLVQHRNMRSHGR